MIFASAKEPDAKQQYKQAERPVVKCHSDAGMVPAFFDESAAEAADTVVHRVESQRTLDRDGHGSDIPYNGSQPENGLYYNGDDLHGIFEKDIQGRRCVGNAHNQKEHV